MQKSGNFTIFCAILLFISLTSLTSSVSAQEEQQQGITVVLNAPQNNTITTQYTQTFNYTPTAINDTFNAACLYINMVPVAYNETAIANATVNSINYTFPSNGVYVWNIQVYNSTAGVYADGNYTLLVNVPPTPTPTETPTITPTPNPSEGALGTSWFYMTLLVITVFLSASAFAIKDAFWSIALKITAALFWFILALSQLFFFGVNSAYAVLSFPYAIFGLLFIVALIRELLAAKHDRIFNFDRFD